MSILISGRAKSGTTGMYTTVKSALPAADPGWVCVFEPARPEQMQALRRLVPEAPVLTKVMLNKEAKAGIDISDFAHRVMMVRDPRDVLISALLFRPLVVRSIRRVDSEGNERFISALETKESDPSSWSVKALYELGTDVGLVSAPWQKQRRELKRLGRRIRDDNFFAMAYEDFVEEKFDGLSDYLGLALGQSTAAKDPAWLAHISRSKGYGAWKHWFLPSDVEFFGELYRPFLKRFGYDDDRELAAAPTIDPATSSQHIRRRLADRKVQLASASGDLDPDEFTRDQLDVLEGQASDGILRAIRIAAEVRRVGRIDLRDHGKSFEWAQLAAWMGDTRGTELLIDSYRSGVGTDKDEVAAELWTERLKAL